MCFFFQAEDGIRYLVRSRGLGDVYKRQVSYEAQRLMDDLVDLELEAVDRILAKIDSDPEPDDVKLVERSTWQLLRDTGKKGRRTGLGFTGLADAIAALGLKYDSDGAREAVEDIMKTKCRAEFDSSIDMAIERGAFQAFDPAVERTSEFVQMLSEELPEVHDRMMKYGRRNISLSTVAPTGSLSLLTRTSSGIEPVYMLSYTRRRKIMGNDPSVEANFTDAQGDQWEEFTVHHPRLLEWMKVTGKTNTSESPYQGSTANDICLLYTSDAADERSSVDLGGRRIIKKKNTEQRNRQQTNTKHI